MKNDFHSANFGEGKIATLNCESRLGIGEATISVIAPETRITGLLLASLNTAKETPKGFVQSISYVLKHLGVGVFQTRAFRFEFCYPFTLREIRKPLLLLLPAITAFFKQLVIEPATFIKLPLKQSSLMFGGLESIFKASVHNWYYTLKVRGCQVKK